jgi:hypothetical protein
LFIYENLFLVLKKKKILFCGFLHQLLKFSILFFDPSDRAQDYRLPHQGFHRGGSFELGDVDVLIVFQARLVSLGISLLLIEVLLRHVGVVDMIEVIQVPRFLATMIMIDQLLARVLQRTVHKLRLFCTSFRRCQELVVVIVVVIIFCCYHFRLLPNFI